MKLADSRVLLTGASGGIGKEVAFELAARGAEVLLSGRRATVLDNIASSIAHLGGKARVMTCDLSEPSSAENLIARATGDGLRLDALVNCAGVSHFGLFENLSKAQLDAIWQTNVTAPMQLASAALRPFKAQGSGLIVNVGSIFGSIGFPCFTAYSASKFALRGFSEALRRELAGSGVGVLYVAPRYTRTPINEGATSRMAEAVSMKQDEPQTVARIIVDAMQAERCERYLGWPERFFVKLNAVFPRLVDKGLREQGERMRPFALSQTLN